MRKVRQKSCGKRSGKPQKANPKRLEKPDITGQEMHIRKADDK